jgi:hypothetical protein
MLIKKDMDYNYIILTVIEAQKVDFTQVKETSIDTVRKSVYDTLSFVEYACEDIDSFLLNLEIIQRATSDELVAILNTNVWTYENTI